MVLRLKVWESKSLPSLEVGLFLYRNTLLLDVVFMLNQESISLFEAVKKENLDQVRSILAGKSQSDIEALVMQKNKVNWTPLFYAMGCEFIADHRTQGRYKVNIDIINLLIGIPGLTGTKEFLLTYPDQYHDSDTRAKYDSTTGLISIYGLFSDVLRPCVREISYDIDPTGQITNYIERDTDRPVIGGFYPTF